MVSIGLILPGLLQVRFIGAINANGKLKYKSELFRMGEL